MDDASVHRPSWCVQADGSDDGAAEGRNDRFVGRGRLDGQAVRTVCLDEDDVEVRHEGHEENGSDAGQLAVVVPVGEAEDNAGASGAHPVDRPRRGLSVQRDDSSEAPPFALRPGAGVEYPCRRRDEHPHSLTREGACESEHGARLPSRTDKCQGGNAVRVGSKGNLPAKLGESPDYRRDGSGRGAHVFFPCF